MDAFEQPASTREEILAATYRALCAHGYADLTMEKIGDEFDKSVSLVYHHYEDKDDLVLSCLEFMLDRFEERSTAPIDDPKAQLLELVDWIFDPDLDSDSQQFRTFLVELRSRACHDPAYRRHFTRTDDVLREHLEDVLEAGIEQGVFRECDPERVSSMILTTLVGTMLRRATHDDEECWLETVRAELDGYLAATVYRE